MRNVLNMLAFVFICILGCFADSLTPEIQPDYIEQLQEHEVYNIGLSSNDLETICNEIDKVAKDNTDAELYKAINEVCKQRGITDSATIAQIKQNYYL